MKRKLLLLLFAFAATGLAFGQTTCSPDAVNYHTGSTDGSAFTQTSLIRTESGDAERGWARFNTSAIPDGHQVSSVELHIYVSDDNYAYFDVMSMEADPLSGTATSVFSDIGDGTQYAHYPSNFPDPGWYVVDLGISAAADLQNLLGSDWFAVGLFEYESYGGYHLEYDGWNETNPPYVIVTHATPPSCLAPNTLTATPGATDASLGWTETGTATSWDIELGIDGFSPSGTPTASGITNPHVYSGLTATTDYEWYVRADCGGSGTSTWSGPHAFTTTCAAESLPWTEGFEGMTTVGSGVLPDCMLEVGDFTTMDAAGTYNRHARTGTHYVYTNFSANDWLFSPPLDLTGGTTYDFTFWYSTNGNSGWTTLEAYFGAGQTSGDMTTAIGTPVSGPTNTTYVEYRGSFTPAATGSYNVGIHVVATFSPWYMCFDDLSVDLPPACPAPSDLTAGNFTTTSADLEWTENGSANEWEIEYGDAGFTQGSGTLITQVFTNDPYVLTGLNGSSQYDYYVRAVCVPPPGPGKAPPFTFSTWAGPSTFTTVCTPITTFPWTEDFEGNFLPVCWSKIVQAGNDITQTSDENHTMGGSFSARFSSYSNSADYNQYLFSRAMTIEEAHRILSFWYKKHNSSPELLEWGIATTADPNDFVWTPVNLTTDWQKINIDLQAYVGQTVYIGFHYYGDYKYYVYLDDVHIGATPPVPVSNWAIVLGVFLIGVFTYVIYRKKRLA